MAADESFQRTLTKVPLASLEAAIADALGELAGVAYTVSIKRLDLHPTSAAVLTDEYEIVLAVRREVTFDSGKPAVPSVSEPSAVESRREPSGPSTRERTVTGLTGRQLNAEWKVGARHALYHHEGYWFHQLKQFPGALFDFSGYVLFQSEQDFRNDRHLNITQDVYVPDGIAAMPSYVRCR